MSEYPYHPQGVGMWQEAAGVIDAHSGFPPKVGDKSHLGRRVTFAQLTPDCQKLVRKDYEELWDLEPAVAPKGNVHAEALKAFPFEYKGGGYWRLKGVEKGEAAPILHGDQVLEAFTIFLEVANSDEDFLEYWQTYKSDGNHD